MAWRCLCYLAAPQVVELAWPLPGLYQELSASRIKCAAVRWFAYHTYLPGPYCPRACPLSLWLSLVVLVVGFSYTAPGVPYVSSLFFIPSGLIISASPGLFFLRPTPWDAPPWLFPAPVSFALPAHPCPPLPFSHGLFIPLLNFPCLTPASP